MTAGRNQGEDGGRMSEEEGRIRKRRIEGGGNGGNAPNIETLDLNLVGQSTRTMGPTFQE